DTEGLLIKEVEKLIKNPATNIEKDYQKMFWQGCAQLGLSPVSRAKLSK
ncbi:P27 family phage terminase small subunit, partial [Turicibacter sanguinis]